MIHSLVTIWALENAAKRRKLTRQCQICRNLQTAADSENEKPVACRKCGAEIPPKSHHRKHTESKQ